MSDRYYESLYPAFEGEPLKSDIGLISNDRVGEGIIARRHFKVGELVFKFKGERVSELNLYTLEHPDGYHLYDPLVMGKALHSCDPNTHCDMRAQTFTAIKPIEVGDYLTMDYDTTESVLFRPFECSCGSKNCRGLIAGRLAKSQNTPTAVLS